ncbi:MAG TPA: hypothetical protein VK947_12650 [Planococcus sp. (in: firmicutes)]|nr:hypothetical protein [Planococcus sp. (in: firmicutes)]
MENGNREEFIIKKYQQDERTMIQLFVQWALNHQLDPVSLYQKAYPGQIKNEALSQAIEDSEMERIDISHETVMEVLQMFGNDDLAFIVAEEIEQLPED